MLTHFKGPNNAARIRKSRAISNELAASSFSEDETPPGLFQHFQKIFAGPVSPLGP
jgi:hypothetical protein